MGSVRYVLELPEVMRCVLEVLEVVLEVLEVVLEVLAVVFESLKVVRGTFNGYSSQAKPLGLGSSA